MIRFGNLQSPCFKGVDNLTSNKVLKNQEQPLKRPEIKELTDVKIPLSVNIPIGYSKLGIATLDNGLEIHNYKLSNGLRVSIVPMETNSTVIRTFVNTGAINEEESQRGISHFLEHMAFNGTSGEDGYKKLSTGDVFRIVGNIGGNTNASTNFALTDYYIQAPIFYDTDLEEIISVQGAMMNNLALPESMIEKERGPVISEINMYSDFPEMLAYNEALKNLYGLQTKSTDYVAGTVENIQGLSKADVEAYYRKNYHPANMFTTLAGDVEPDEAIKLIAKHFHTQVKNVPPKKIDSITPIETSIRRDFVSSKTLENKGFVMFNGPKNSNLKDQIVMDFVCSLLFGSANARITKHIDDTTISMNMGIEKVSTNPSEGQMLYFEYSAHENEYEKALEVLYSELGNFKKPTQESIDKIKKSKLNTFDRRCKNPSSFLSMLGNTHFTTGDNSIMQYRNLIQSITADDVVRCVDKYLDLSKASIAVVHPKEKVNISEVSFKGVKKRQVFKPENIKTYKFNNNFDVASYDTKGDYKYSAIMIGLEKDVEHKPGTYILLDAILNDGVEDFTRQQFDMVLADKLISNSISAGSGGIRIFTHCNKEEMPYALSLAMLQLYKPNLTEEALSHAKDSIKKYLEVKDTTSTDLIYSAVLPNTLDDNKDAILANIDSITLDDVKQLHKSILEKGVGQVAFTTSANDEAYSNKILEVINSFKKVVPKTYDRGKEYVPVDKSVVKTYVNSNAQADVSIGYKYKTNSNMKDDLLFSVVSELLSKNAFNDLREQQQLAYRVEAFNMEEDAQNSVLMCNILTTTKDEESGMVSYDNVQKSIDGFFKLIEDLKNGDFSEDDLQAVKLEIKGRMLQASDSEAVKTKLLLANLKNPYGVLATNKEYSLIDSLTKEEVIAAARHIFAVKPVFGITANNETLEFNKEYFKELAGD